MALDRTAILSRDDLPREEVQTPEWGGSVFVRMMTASERDQWDQSHSKDPWHDIRARIAAFTVCDEDGKLLFTPDDIPTLSSKSAAALSRIFPVAWKLNGLGKDQEEALVKNS